ERGGVLVRNEFPGDDARNKSPLGGSRGQYRVLFTLTRPGIVPVPEREFSFDPDIPGDSHLAVAAPALKPVVGSAAITAIKIYAQTEDGSMVFTGHPNKRGFLGRLEAVLEADSFADAERRGFRAIASSLSNWSAQLDIPLH